MIKRLVLLGSILLAPVLLVVSKSRAADLGAIQIFSAVDLVGEFGIQNPPVDSGRVRVRGFEVAAFAPVDTLFDALVNVAGHDEAGQIEIELHEAYIASTRLIPRTRLKVGRFFLGVGRLNQYHSHDWPFTSAPKSHSTFFSEEAATDTGLELGHLFDSSIPIDLVAGVTNGWTYGHSHTGGRRPLVATHYVRPTFFFDFGDSRGLLVGLNYLGRTDADSIQTRLTGFDATYKRRNGKTLSTLVQTEFYHRLQTSATLPLKEEIGGYMFADFAIGEEGWSAGTRLDAFTDLSLKFGTGDRRGNFDFAIVPVLSFKNSEFSTFRLSYTYGQETREGDNARAEQKVEIQLIALIGAHPAHDF